MRFGFGLVLGVLIGAATSSLAAIIAGDDGYLMEWSVTKDGEEICTGPYVWNATKEIECD